MLLDRPVKVTEDDFEATVLGSSAPVLVDFFAEWCGPCKVLAPMLDEIANQNVGRLVVAKVDTDQAQKVAAEYEIRGVPTVVLFRDGVEVDRSVGIEPQRLAEMVEAVSEGFSDTVPS
ncbi:MAG: thioredoxin [Longimicrobiales bacterium]